MIRESGKIGGAAAFETHNSTQEIYEAAALPGRPYGELLPSEQPGSASPSGSRSASSG